MKKVEYSQIAIRKLKDLKIQLAEEYGVEISTKIIKQISTATKNYIFYRIEPDKIYIVDIFHEKEDFMYKLFGIKTMSDNIIYFKNR